MFKKIMLSYGLAATAAFWKCTVSAEAQVSLDSGVVRELILAVRDPGLPELGWNWRFQIGDALFSYEMTDLFHMSLLPRAKRLAYCGIDSQVVESLNNIIDSLSDGSWDDLKVKYDTPIRFTSLHSGYAVIDSNVNGRCLEYVAKYAVIDAYSNCDERANVFNYVKNSHSRHIFILHVDTSTVRELPFDEWIVEKIVENRKKLVDEVFRSK